MSAATAAALRTLRERLTPAASPGAVAAGPSGRVPYVGVGIVGGGAAGFGERELQAASSGAVRAALTTAARTSCASGSRSTNRTPIPTG